MVAYFQPTGRIMKKYMNCEIKDIRRKEKSVNIVVALSVTTVLFLALSFFFDVVYCLNDDLMIQSILSGRYSGSPSGKAVYLSEPLSSLLALLYRLLPSIPWLGLFLAGCYALCFFLALYASLEKFLKDARFTRKGRVIATACVCILAVTIFCGFFLNQILMIHYTVVAAVLGGTAIYFFLLSEDIGEWRAVLRSTWLPVLLLLLCYLVRTKVFFMVVPFLAVAGLYRILCTKRFVPYLIPIAMLGAGLLLLMLIGHFSYGSQAWQEYLAYNDARTELYDYVRIREEDEAAGYYADQGYASEEMEIYRDYNILLNEDLTAEDFRKMSAYEEVDPQEQRTWFQKFKEGFWLYRHRAFGKTEDYPYNIVMIALYIIAVLAVIGSKDKKCLWIIALLGAVRSSLWIYLLAAGRYPERIVISLYLIELLVLLSMITDIMKRNFRTETDTETGREDKDRPIFLNQRISALMGRIGMVFVGVVFLILASETAWQVLPKTLETMEQQKETNREEDQLFDFMKSHPENLYLLDVYAVVNHTEYALKDYDGSYENYLLLGGWVAGSPLVSEKLFVWGYGSAFDALDHGENVYLVLKEGVGMDLKELEEFYSWRTGGTAVFRRVEDVGADFGIYQKVSE